jgi:hypothetical protein
MRSGESCREQKKEQSNYPPLYPTMTSSAANARWLFKKFEPASEYAAKYPMKQKVGERSQRKDPKGNLVC